MQKKIALGARIILGLIFTVFGLNGFLNFIPAPPLEGLAGQVAGAFAASGYMFPLIKGLEVLTGLMFLSGKQVPLALILLSPIAVNIFLFHFILTGPATSGMGLLIIVLMLFLFKYYWSNFQGIFKT